MSIASGTRLGPYEVICALGVGGMGEVYKARDTRLDRTVAIKVLPATLVGDPALRQRMEREARAISSLDHPHICALYDVGREQPQPASGDGRQIDFLVMQHLEGETLAARLERGPLPVKEALQIAAQVAEALAAAHRRGIVHRDLKPGNVMLTKTGARLLDFGLAKQAPAGGALAGPSADPMTVATPLTAERTIIGTLQYMAPEQLEGRDVDARTDLFALGAVSDESDRVEVYVRAYPSGDMRSQISASGGGQPRWRRDGGEIYYVSPAGTMMAVPVLDLKEFAAGAPVALFNEPSLRINNSVFFYGGAAAYDVDREGRRFLVNHLKREPTAGPIHVVLNAVKP